MKPLPSSSAYAGWLAVARILTGVMWLAHAIPKFSKSDEFMPPNGFMVMYVTQGLQHTTGAYHNFLANVVQPNLPIYAELVRLGELLTGIVLVLGVFTRLGGLIGMVLPLNYLAARGNILTSAALQSLDFSMFVLSAISFVLPTGRGFGIDALLARRKRPAPTVRAEFVPEPPPPAAEPTPPPGATSPGPTTPNNP
jgi:thiosulfate dehydrogenase (quinone) large subunit